MGQKYARLNVAGSGEHVNGGTLYEQIAALGKELEVTRKRGVGRRILDEARRLAREAGKSLHLAAPRDHLESQALAARTGLPLDDL